MNNMRSLSGIRFVNLIFDIRDSVFERAFEDDVAALASWKSASHVEVPPKKKTPPPTPTP